MEKTCAVILAAGKGTRMKSDSPKALKEVLFKPMVSWVLDTVEQAGVPNVCTVTAGDSPALEALLSGRSETALQPERLGTGHAAKMALPFFSRYDSVLVLAGDAPFLDAATIQGSYQLFRESGAAACVITAQVETPTGYGRILRENGRVAGIVEERDATPGQKAIREISGSAFWFSSPLLAKALEALRPDNAQGEYYLTDTLSWLLSQGHAVTAFCSENPSIVLGANDRWGLYQLNETARQAVIRRHMENGVEFVNLDGVLISPDVEIGPDTLILPGTILRGKSKIGAGCVVGPGSVVIDSTIGNRSVFNASQMTESTIGSDVKVGPYCHLRPGSVLEDRVKVGDFVEIKNSTIGEKTSLAHLTYIGDSDIGKGINFGGGCITCNYDGKAKYRTVVGDNAFIGCNTNLVAPVTVGQGAFIAAGSTITQDVDADALAIARGRQVAKEGWAAEYWKKK